MTSDLPRGAARSPDGPQVTSTDRAQIATPGGFPWRSVGASAASIGTPIGISILHPLLGEVLAVVELAIILIVLGTALFGSKTLSDRAFRLLRWLGNRSEPPEPTGR